MSTQVRPMSAEELQELMKAEIADREAHSLSPEEQDPLAQWVESGILPGEFLQAVLRNDLKDACGRADIVNRRKLFEYIEWLYNQAPALCWGSQEKVDAWQARFTSENPTQ